MRWNNRRLSWLLARRGLGHGVCRGPGNLEGYEIRMFSRFDENVMGYIDL